MNSEKRSARRILGTCCATHALHDGLADLLYVLLPVLAQSFNLSFAQVGLVRSVQATAFAVFQLPAGMLGERLGERTLLGLGTAIAGLAFLGFGLSGGFLFLLVFLFLAGLGGAFQHPLCSSIVSNAYPEGGRRAALGVYNFAGDAGKLAFAGATGLAIAAGVAWRGPVLLYGVLAVAAAASIWVLLRRFDAGNRPAPVGDPVHPATHWGIRSRNGFAALCGIAVIDSSTRSGLLTFIAFLMIGKGVSEGLAPLAVPMVFLGGMLGKLACGFLAERLGVIRTVVLTELATGAGILVALALPDLAAFALLPVIGIALNGTSSVLYGTIGDLIEPDRQSRAFGLVYTLGSSCGIAAPLGYGLLGDAIGIEATVAVIGGVVFLSIPLCRMLRPELFSGAGAPARGGP
ncbi:MAG: MFS transporter [Kiloniellaceae bacterium]